MKRVLALALSLLLLGGCAEKEENSSSASLLTGETVSGIITKVNGNEITLDLVTLASDGGFRGAAGETPSGESGETPSPDESGEARQGERPSGDDRGSRRESGEGRSGPPDRGGMPSGGGDFSPGDLGETPQGAPSFEGGAGSGGNRKSYTRTGETALYQIPVGASVLTLTGTSRGFNSLSTDLLVTITFREDGVTPGQVQVIQSLS